MAGEEPGNEAIVSLCFERDASIKARVIIGTAGCWSVQCYTALTRTKTAARMRSCIQAGRNPLFVMRLTTCTITQTLPSMCDVRCAELASFPGLLYTPLVLIAYNISYTVSNKV